MNSKQILMGIVALAVLAGGGYYLYNSATPETPENTDGNAEEEVVLTTFSSDELGLSFDYPASYTLETQADGNEERSWTTLVIIEASIREEYEASGAMEGPPAITVQVFENIEGYELEEWITTTSYSNYKLATDEVLLEGEVGGEPARAYAYSGLYENNSIVVAHEGKIYMFTVSWLTQDDKNIYDFGNLLESVNFD